MKTLFVISAVVALLVAGATSAFVPESTVRFVDATAKVGIHFQHNTGATGKRYLPETLGSGVAFVDIDGDGWAYVFTSIASAGLKLAPDKPLKPILVYGVGSEMFLDLFSYFLARDARINLRRLYARVAEQHLN